MTTVNGFKSKEEVDELKSQWIGDPSWDIEDTEGFEAYRKQLRDWRFQYEENKAIKENVRLTLKSQQLGCSIELVGYIEALERRLKRLEDIAN